MLAMSPVYKPSQAQDDLSKMCGSSNLPDHDAYALCISQLRPLRQHRLSTLIERKSRELQQEQAVLNGSIRRCVGELLWLLIQSSSVISLPGLVFPTFAGPYALSSWTRHVWNRSQAFLDDHVISRLARFRYVWLLKSSRSQSSKAMAQACAWNAAAESGARLGSKTVMYGIDALEMVGVAQGDTLLDIASGPGDLAMYAASEKGAVVDAIDVSSEHISALQRSLQTNPACVTAHIMDGQQLRFQDHRFDVTVSCFGVFLFPDYKEGLSEMYRVTKPGGRASVVAWADVHRGVVRVWAHLFDQEFPEVLPLTLPAGVAQMSTLDGMSKALVAAGFADVKAEEVVHTWHLPSPAAFTDMLMNNPLIDAVRQRLTPERQSELVPRVTELLQREYRHGDGLAFDAVAVIGCGSKPST